MILLFHRSYKGRTAIKFPDIIELFAHPFTKGFIIRAGEKGSIVIRFMSEFLAIFFSWVIFG